MTRGWAAFVAIMLAAALAFGLLVGLALGHREAQLNPSPELAPAVTVVREPWPADLQAAFDEGFGAGQEYQEWFNCNTVIPMTEMPPE